MTMDVEPTGEGGVLPAPLAPAWKARPTRSAGWPDDVVHRDDALYRRYGHDARMWPVGLSHRLHAGPAGAAGRVGGGWPDMPFMSKVEA